MKGLSPLVLKLPRPSPKQLEFLRARERYVAFIGGIGSGKTTAGALRCFLEVFRNFETPQLGVVVAPSYRMLTDVNFRLTLDFFGPVLREVNRTEMRVKFLNGAEILFRSSDEPDRLRGLSVDFAWMDEASLCAEEAFQILLGRLRRKPGAPLWITTTPKGVSNWVYRYRDMFRVIQARTEENPGLDPQFIESLKKAYDPLLAKQELEGEFISLEGMIFEEVSARPEIFRDLPEKPQMCFGGIDYGYTHPSAIILVGKVGEEFYVFHEFYAAKMLFPQLLEVARSLQESFQVGVFMADPSEPALISEAQKLGLRVRAAPKEGILTGIQRIKGLFHEGRLFISPACRNLIREMMSLAWEEGKDRPARGPDHAVDALRYALTALTRYSESDLEAWGRRVGVSVSESKEDPIVKLFQVGLRGSSGSQEDNFLW